MDDPNSATGAQIVLNDPASARAFGRDQAAGPPDDLRRMSTRELLERIRVRHDSHLRRVLIAVAPLAVKVARVHGDQEPKLPLLAAVVRELVDALGPHLDEEEEVLFPALADGWDVTLDIKQTIDEHGALLQMLDRIREASDRFRAPPWACAHHRALMRDLRGLDADLRKHLHLENQVLFPRFASPPVDS